MSARKKKPRDSLADFILDQLSDIDAVVCRAMFGGYGLYADGQFFGIVAAGHLYFKTDDRTRESYRQRKMPVFQPRPGQTLKRYYQVPVDVLEDRRELCLWAKAAISLKD